MSAGPDKARKKEIARAWTDRPRVQGVFAVRCLASDELWVSTTRNLDTQQNGVWFALRSGSHPNKALQATWRTHGPDAFVYEVVEEIPSVEGLTPLGLADCLKARLTHWREALGAKLLVG